MTLSMKQRGSRDSTVKYDCKCFSACNLEHSEESNCSIEEGNGGHGSEGGESSGTVPWPQPVMEPGYVP